MAWNLPVVTAVLLGLGVSPAAQVMAQADVVARRMAEPSAAYSSQRDNARIVITRQMVEGAQRYLLTRESDAAPDSQATRAWQTFYSRCDRLIRHYSGKFQRSGVDPEDCAQDVWSQLLRTLPAFELKPGRGQFNSWLYAVVRSKANDILRKSARQQTEAMSAEISADLATRDADPSENCERQETIQCVRNALATLRRQVSDTSFQVLHLRQIQGKTVDETAQLLGISPQQVWARDHRMRRKLRDLIASGDTEPRRLDSFRSPAAVG
jgi:RNA polymerase sigma-70 factor (ECF subfamily)